MMTHVLRCKAATVEAVVGKSLLDLRGGILYGKASENRANIMNLW